MVKKIGYDTEGSGTSPAPKWTMEAVLGADDTSQNTSTTTEQKQTASTDIEQPAASSITTQNKPDLTGDDYIIDTLKKGREQYERFNETPEQVEARERRERAARKISAVSDGLRAISNLYFTTQYAPNMYNHEKDSQLAQVDARQEKLKAEREKGRDAYLNYSLKIGDAMKDRAKTVRELEAEAERRRLANDKNQREAEAHGWKAALQPDLQRKAVADANAAESKASSAKAEADNAEAMQQAKLETEKQRGRTEQTKQQNNRASAAAHGRSNVMEFVAYDENGRAHPFKTKAGADNFAKQHGTFQEEDKTEKTSVTSTDRRGKTTTRTQDKTTSGGGYARKPAQGDNTPPSRRGNNDNTPPSRRK